jgi:hypothetical protein
MLSVMTLRHQKSFLRKVSDEVEGAKIFGELKDRRQEDWVILRDTSEAIGKLQGGIDQTLDKIRTKVLDRTLEADQLLKKYTLMLKQGEHKPRGARM